MTSMQYGWHAQSWRMAHAAIARGAHALLIAGAQGLGKRDFALALAATHLCAARVDDAAPCGSCGSCRWFAAGTHPDFILVEPVKDEPEAEGSARASAGARERPISVDQVRQLGESLALSSHRASGKVVVIHPAEAMNLAACNALLKNLEEPPSRTVFMLVSHRPALLPPTVLSRCQRIHMAVLDRSVAERWLNAQGVQDAGLRLALCGGAPLEALSTTTDALWARRPELMRSLSDQGTDGVVLAERFRDVPAAIMLSWLQKWTFDLLCMLLSGRARYHVDLAEAIRKDAAGVDPRALARLHRRLLARQRHVHHPLNPRLFSEQLLIDCRQVLAGPKGA